MVRDGVCVAEGSDDGVSDGVLVGIWVGAGGNATVVGVAVGSGVGEVLQAETAVITKTNTKRKMHDA